MVTKKEIEKAAIDLYGNNNIVNVKNVIKVLKERYLIEKETFVLKQQISKIINSYTFRAKIISLKIAFGLID